MRILVFGASGMLGNAMFRVFGESAEHEVMATARTEGTRRHFSAELSQRLLTGIDIDNHDSVVRAFATAMPDVVINCVGIVKQVADVEDLLQAIPRNTLFPHRLAQLCRLCGARLVHVSTDCVFSGTKGMYTEADQPDAPNLYGRSKLLGEVSERHTITLRTSIIGTEQSGARSLVGWFLAQEGRVKGYRKAIFSGLPTVELSTLVRDYVLPQPEIHGLYHIAAEPIDKESLLRLVAAEYGKEIEIEPCDEVVIDRSLDASRFREATGYVPPPWPELVRRMHTFN
jgi:dTDP-4-dehydrorhamnose reductase